MSKKVKELELNDLRRTLKGVKDLVLLEPLKLDSAADYESAALRSRAKKIRVKMVKNSLVKKIFTENGVKADPGSGPTLVCWGGNSIKELSTAVEDMMKVLKPDAKSPEKLKEKTAVADGEPVTLKVATTLPTRLEAIGKRGCGDRPDRVRPSPAPHRLCNQPRGHPQGYRREGRRWCRSGFCVNFRVEMGVSLDNQTTITLHPPDSFIWHCY